MSRRVYLLGVGLALVALGLAFTDWALSLQPGTEPNLRRIRPGMSLADVESLLGSPGRMPLVRPMSGPRFGGVPDKRARIWENEAGVVRVWLDEYGRVVGITRWCNPARPQRSAFAQLRAWLGW